VKIKNVIFVIALIVFLISGVLLLSEIMWHIGYYMSVNYFPVKHTGFARFILFMNTLTVSIILGFVALVFLMLERLFEIKSRCK
jgi:uncharacterized membrane protein